MFTKKVLIWAMMISLVVVVGGSLIFNNPFNKTAEAKSQQTTCPAPQVWDPVMNACTCRVCENPGVCGSFGACNCGGCSNKPGYGLSYTCSVTTGIGHCISGSVASPTLLQ